MSESMEANLVLVAPNLLENIRKYPDNFVVPFYHTSSNPTSPGGPLIKSKVFEVPWEKDWKWHDKSFVRLPFSKSNSHAIGRGEWTPKWIVLKSIFDKLCGDINSDPSSGGRLLSQAIRDYNGGIHCNFGVIKDSPDLSTELGRVLPEIVKNALALETRLKEPIPILRRGQNRTLYLTRELAASLLANAFLCTFPEQEGRSLPDFHFFNLFHNNGDQSRTELKREKLKCIFEYFRQLSTLPEEDLHSIISFERRCIKEPVNWSAYSPPLCRVEFTAGERIERAEKMLQVDFANKVVGGGVLNEGAVQEEIRFLISPELICSRLFTEHLNDDEVLVITGTRQFSSYSGYGSSFKFERLDLEEQRPLGRDNFGREFTQIVAMDALHFKPNDLWQYQKDAIQRELHKAYVAFYSGRYKTPVATGNWGCGAFNGDPQLKFLIQWMAASKNERPGMRFFARNRHQAQEFSEMYSFLLCKKVTVAKLHKALMKYKDSCISSFPFFKQKCTVFDFLRERLNKKDLGFCRI